MVGRVNNREMLIIMASMCVFLSTNPNQDTRKVKKNTHHNKGILSRVNLSMEEGGEKTQPIM